MAAQIQVLKNKLTQMQLPIEFNEQLSPREKIEQMSALLEALQYLQQHWH